MPDWLDRSLTLARRAVSCFFSHRGPQFAAAIAFFLLLSIFPLAILATSIAGLVADDESARADVTDFFVDNLPLAEREGRQDLEDSLRRVTSNATGVGVLGLVGVLISASAVIGAVRNALGVVWGVTAGRPPLIGKLFDLTLASVLGVLVTASLGAAVVEGALLDAGGVAGALARALDASGPVVPMLLAALLFGMLLRFVPDAPTPLRDVWPGIVVATIGYWGATQAFSYYVSSFGRYDLIYGSIGAVIAFMVLVYVAAIAFLLGAECAARWPEVRDGDEATEPGDPIGDQLKGFLRSLVKRQG